jgi:hypothetical protein
MGGAEAWREALSLVGAASWALAAPKAASKLANKMEVRNMKYSGDGGKLF